MAETIAQRLVNGIGQAPDLYHRLILLVAPIGGGKTAALREVRNQTGAPLVNVNLELSSLMLELSSRQRTLQLPSLMNEIVAQSKTDTILLDNIELLFDVTLKQDPLRLLQGISRNKTVVAAWGGTVKDGYLTYAEPDNSKYRRYPSSDLLIVTPALI